MFVGVIEVAVELVSALTEQIGAVSRSRGR